MLQLLARGTVLIFLFVSLVLTNVSLLFPQEIGNYQKVAGWPFTVYKIQYRRQDKIESTGRIVHSIVKDSSQIMWGKALANIIFWTVLLELTWITSHRLLEGKAGGIAT